MRRRLGSGTHHAAWRVARVLCVPRITARGATVEEVRAVAASRVCGVVITNILKQRGKRGSVSQGRSGVKE